MADILEVEKMQINIKAIELKNIDIKNLKLDQIIPNSMNGIWHHFNLLNDFLKEPVISKLEKIKYAFILQFWYEPLQIIL